MSELLKTIGVKIEEVKSSPLKAAPNGYEPTSPEARAAIEALVMDSYDWFKDMVRDRRKLDQAGLDKVADGRVFTGRQAMALKLVDSLGNEQTAIDWLAKEKNIDPEDAGPRLPDDAAVRRPAVPARRDGARCSTRSASPRWPGGWRTGAPCRRSSGSTLTVYWRFGTLL